MTGPIISGIVFSLLVITLALWKPNGARIFLGFFFIAMGIGVNVPFVLMQPNFVLNYGQGAWLPLYRTLSDSIIAINPAAFGILLIIFEVLMGFLLLNKGTKVKIGLVGISLFVIMLTPLYISQIAWAGAVIGFGYLLTQDFDKNLSEMIQDRRKGNKKEKTG